MQFIIFFLIIPDKQRHFTILNILNIIKVNIKPIFRIIIIRNIYNLFISYYKSLILITPK